MGEGRVVFTGANLIDGEGVPRPGAHLVVEGERIARVGEGPPPDVGPDDRGVDLAGRTLMPGMVQCHFHTQFGAFGGGVTAPALGLEASPAYLAVLAAANLRTALHCGFTSAVGSSNAYATDVALKEAMLHGHTEGPRFLACSPELVTTGEASDFPNNRNWFMQLGNTGLTRKADGVEAWRLAVREEAGRGADVIKMSASPGHGSSPARDVMYPTRDELRACVETAHNLGRRVRAHVASRTGILECARAGVDIIDHADRLDAECIDAILAADCTVVPSMLWTVRFLEFAESWDHAAQPFPISEGFPEPLEATLARIRGVREDYEHTCRMMPEAHRAGVKLVVGDDFGTPIMPHGDYVSELELYVKQLGIPPLDVIRWATKNGGELVDPGGDLGTLAEGKLADLLVVDGDPVADIGCLRDRVQAVVQGGRFVVDALGQAPPPGA